MDTLAYGRKRPQDNDKGSQFWDALRDNITRDDAHTHDDVDSPAFPRSNLTIGTTAVTGTGWTLNADGTYKKTVSCPGGFTYANSAIRVFASGGAEDGQEIFAKTVFLTASTFEVHLLVGDQALTVNFY